MKNQFIIVFFLLMVVSCTEIYSQSRFRLELTGGASLNIKRSENIFSNWGNGFIFGGGFVYKLFPSFDLAMNVSYQNYPYVGGNLQIIDPLILGWHYSVSGHGSNIIESSLVFRNSPKKTLFYPIFSLRVGVLRSHIGDIDIQEWSNLFPASISPEKYQGSGTVDTKGFAALGLGLNIPLNTNHRLILESRITQTFDLEQTFVPIILTFQHDLIKKSNR